MDSTDPTAPATVLPDPPSERRRIVSADGTEIALERTTRGPQTLLTLSGGPSLRSAWARVAAHLDGQYSCWLMDRRGKGDSGDTPPYALEREYEDVAAAVASLDGPVTLAGHSSGAICALGAALGDAQIAQLALYEPPWPVGRPRVPAERIDAVEMLAAAGDRAAALELALRDIIGIPQAVIDALRGSPPWIERCALVHTWPREMREVEALPPDVSHLAAITVPTLMIHGSHSPHYLLDSTRSVARVLPSARVVGLAGQSHDALGTAPEAVAGAILTGLPR